MAQTRKPRRAPRREYVVVYRWCSEHRRVEKGRRYRDGSVKIVKPEGGREVPK